MGAETSYKCRGVCKWQNLGDCDGGILVTRYDKRFDTAANVLQDDGSRIVCRLKQTCRPTRAALKWVMTVTDVMILNYAVGLDVARDETQS